MKRRTSRAWRTAPVLAIAAIAVFLLSVASATAGRTTDDGSVLRATLKNGLRVVIVKNTQAAVVTTVVNYLVGSNASPAGFPGMAHAQEHMMFRGSPGLSGDQLADIMAYMGGNFNADTQQTVTQYIFTVAQEDLGVALRIESIRMSGALDNEQAWKEERGAIEQEVAQDLSDPDYIFYARLFEIMFKDTPYEQTPLGTFDSFNKTTGAMLKKFYDTWYAPNNAILVIVGHVEPISVLREVEKYFAAIPRKDVPVRPSVTLKPVKPQSFTIKTDHSYGQMTISFRMPGYENDDYTASEVLADVLTSQRGRLYQLVVDGKALDIDFSLSTLPEAGLAYVAASFPKGADPAPLANEVRRVIAEDVKKGFSPDLIEAAKRSRLTRAELQKNSVPGLAMAWSQALAVEGRQSPDDALNAIQKVSPSDVNRVAAKYLRFDHAVDALLIPEAAGKPVSAKAKKGMESFAPKEIKSVPLPEWADRALNRLSLPVSTVNPEVRILPNGLTLIMQYASVSDTANVYGHVKNSPFLETPQGKEGVERVLSPLFAFGTVSRDRVAFQKALDDIGADMSVGTDFSLQVLSRHFERGVELLADNMLHPAFPEEAFKTLRKQTADEVAGELESPDYLTRRALKTSLFPLNDVALREATPKTISSLTLRNVTSYYGKVFRPDLTTIVFIGKVSPDEVSRVIEKYFGPWKAEGPKPETDLPPVPQNRSSATAVPDISRSQTKVTLAETLGLTRSHPDYYALDLGNHVLGGAFYSTWLYRDLREKTGLVYYVSSLFDIGRTRSVYEVRYSCDPGNVARARAIIEGDLARMQKAPVTADELKKAQSLVLRETQLAEASIDNIALGLIYRATHDLPLDEPIRAAQRYVKITPTDVQAAFAKWLRIKDMVQVTQGPLPE